MALAKALLLRSHSVKLSLLVSSVTAMLGWASDHLQYCAWLRWGQSHPATKALGFLASCLMYPTMVFHDWSGWGYRRALPITLPWPHVLFDVLVYCGITFAFWFVVVYLFLTLAAECSSGCCLDIGLPQWRKVIFTGILVGVCALAVLLLLPEQSEGSVLSVSLELFLLCCYPVCTAFVAWAWRVRALVRLGTWLLGTAMLSIPLAYLVAANDEDLEFTTAGVMTQFANLIVLGGVFLALASLLDVVLPRRGRSGLV